MRRALAIAVFVVCVSLTLGGLCGGSKPKPNPIDSMIVVYWLPWTCDAGWQKAPEYRVSLPHREHPGIGWTEARFPPDAGHLMQEGECTGDPLNLGIHWRECCVQGEEKQCTPISTGAYPAPCSAVWTIGGEQMTQAHVDDWNARHISQ
jgi:hypothetical protein